MLRRITGRRRSVLEPRDVGCGDFACEVVGESHYQSTLALAALRAETNKKGRQEVPVRLVREPRNRHDRNAVAVHVVEVGCVGYLPRERASRVAPLLDGLIKQGCDLYCRGILIGGPSAGLGFSWGVVLDLDERELEGLVG